MHDNYMTHFVYLWLNNDESQYYYWRQKAKDLLAAYLEETEYAESETIIELARIMRDEIVEEVPTTHGLYHDLLMAALDTVDWEGLARGFVGSISEEV